jgi:spore germination cell wall hydrolase CwlJ-like protein
VSTVAAHPAPLRPEVECIARAVYREAANQALSGQLAVAQVIMNRARSGEYPKGVCAVVGQPGQFSQNPVTLATTASKPWSAAVAIATIAEEHRVAQIAPGALFFHAASMRPAWSDEHERIAQIGDHIFYR